MKSPRTTKKVHKDCPFTREQIIEIKAMLYNVNTANHCCNPAPVHWGVAAQEYEQMQAMKGHRERYKAWLEEELKQFTKTKRIMNDIIINNSNVWITRQKTVRARLRRQEKIDNRPTWYKMLKLGNWRLYITKNIRLKRRNKRDDLDMTFNRIAFRKHCYERSGHKCEICGKELTWETNELHHILPIHRFPQFAMDERNMQCLCHSCHKGIHCDPYKTIKQIEQKAKEFGVDLKEYYDV